MKRPQKNDPEPKNEEPPDFYRVSKLSPLPEPGQQERPAERDFRPGSSTSSAYAPNVKDDESDSPRADETESGHQGFSSLDSWDQGRKGQSEATQVAINLCDVYDREVSPPGRQVANQLSEADLQYLIQQNRALLKQASLKHQKCRYENHG